MNYRHPPPGARPASSSRDADLQAASCRERMAKGEGGGVGERKRGGGSK